jgi:hypothetical protein
MLIKSEDSPLRPEAAKIEELKSSNDIDLQTAKADLPQ